MKVKIKRSCLLFVVYVLTACVFIAHFWPALQRALFWLQQTVAGWW